MKHILVDIDHVLSDAFHRDEMMGTNTWDEYHEAGKNDLPLLAVVDAINTLGCSGYTIIGLTARPAKWRTATVTWLAEFGVLMEDILMRQQDDYRPAPEVKVSLALAKFGSEQAIRDNVAFIMDDRDDVIAAFQAIGVTALQVFARRKA